MRQGFWLIMLFFALSTQVFGRLSYSEWRRIQREFQQKIKRKEEEVIQALKKLKDYDDPRVAEMIIQKSFDLTQPFVLAEAKKVLETYKEAKTIDRITDLAEREHRKEKKFQLLLILGAYKGHPKVEKVLKNSLRDRDWKILSATLRAIQKGGFKNLAPYVKRVFRKYGKKNPRLAYESAWALKSLGEALPKDYQQTQDFLLPKKFFGKSILFLVETSLAMDQKVSLPKNLAKEKRWKNLASSQKVSLLELVQYALEKGISRLDKRTEFNIVSVSESKKFWKKKGMKAKDSQIRSALSFIKRMRTKPGFDLYGAIQRAFQYDDQWDTIYILCTSLPKGGYYNTAEKSLPHILKICIPAFATVKVRSLMILPGKGYNQISKLRAEEKVEKIRTYYKKLASHSYGSYQEVSFLLDNSASSKEVDKKEKRAPFTIQRDKAGRIPYDEWNRIRRKLLSLLPYPTDKEEVLEVIEKIAGADDPRGVELIIQKVLSQDKPSFIFAALKGLKQNKDKKSIQQIIQMFQRERSSKIRLLLLQVLSHLKGEEVEKALLSVARGKDPKEVRLALQGLVKIGTQRSIYVLKKWARKKKEGLLSYYASLALQKITGSKGPEEKGEKGGFISPYPSTHVAFALCQSESMGDKVEISKEEYKKITGKDWKKKEAPSLSKMEIAKYHIRQAIEKLPRDAEFTVIRFDSSITFYQKRLVRASSNNKKRALNFLEKSRPKLEQNLHGLWKRLAKLKDLDTIYIVMDGLPKGGYVEDPKTVRQNITQQNFSLLMGLHFRLILTGTSEKDSKISKAARSLKIKEIQNYYQTLAKWNYGSLKWLQYPKK